MEKKRKTLVLLDGNALIHRSYHALPPLSAKNGEAVQAVYGFAMTLLSVLEKFKPDYIAASFDLEGKTFRDDLYTEYKATRTKAPDDLYTQIPRVKEVVQAFNIPIYEKAGFEADDCVGTIARQAEKEGLNVIIVTGDNDTLQLVTDQVKVFTLRKGLKDMVLLGIPEVQAKYGFAPTHLIDYKGLRGDASDNIPGVKGIGEKTATDLIREFGSLEDIYKQLEKVKPKIREKLESDKETAFLSKKLGTIDTKAPVQFELSAAVTQEFDRAKVTTLFHELGFFSLVKRLEKMDGEHTSIKGEEKKVVGKREKSIKTKAELDDFLKTADDVVAITVEQEKESLFGSGLVGLGMASGEKSAFVEWNEATAPLLKKFLADDTRKKVMHDYKQSWHLLKKLDAGISGVVFDTLLAAYAINPGGKVELDALFFEYLGEGSPLSPLHQARALRELQIKLEAKMEAIAKEQAPGKTVETIFRALEMPLAPILFTMEENGILLDREKCSVLSRELDRDIKKTEEAVVKLAGRAFNLNSPKQLAEILFGELKIPTENIKKNKTGFSTASPELQKLRAEYPIIELIERYRELFKLKNTYVDVLPTLIGPDGRLHTTFQQAVAATGRLSSADPNLQNIPIKTEWGTRLREAFRAAPGFVLVGADYSQIELRIAAHLSSDKNMLSAFQKNEDIHRTTAALVHGIKLEEVTDRMRREAKVLNFGIIYGMGTFGLAQAAQIDQKAARLFIQNYLKKFSGVAEYMEAMRKMAHDKGYVETELGRRRYLPEIQSGNRMMIAAGERMAINMPVQGLAADIVKLAMLKTVALTEKYTAKMLLQVHDELIFEVKQEESEAFAEELKEMMEHVYTLKVPLVVSVAIGNNWGEI